MLKRAFVLLGAGASIEYGAPSTAQVAHHIESALASTGPTRFAGAEAAYREIRDGLQGYLSGPANFEQIFHVANELLAIQAPVSGAVDEYKPILHPFLTSSLAATDGDLRLLLDTMTRTIFSRFSEACASNVLPLDPLSRFYETLRREYVCRTYTTNYDDFVLQAVPDLYTGFPAGGSVPRRFDLDRFWSKQDVSSLFYVHGSVHMGFPFRGGDIGELLWFDDLDQAASNAVFSGASGRSRKMTGTSFLPTAVVTGLDKLSLLQQRPLSHYYAAMGPDAMSADVIFVIGSGLTDLHLNSWLHEARSRTPPVPLLYVDYWPNGFEDSYFELDAKSLELFHGLKVHVSEAHRGTREGGWLVSQDRTAAVWDGGFQSFLGAPDELREVMDIVAPAH